MNNINNLALLLGRLQCNGSIVCLETGILAVQKKHPINDRCH